ncbi:contractile injection system tape measure protein [Undibacterium sp. TJN19]|uniref:contractile injection system tape measure protein n=1 Tax=Undibacterium sp. TJN19 TaxID=3413055 RepID=UPI003BF31DDF
MKPSHVIGDLEFDFSFAFGQMEESDLSEWVSHDLLVLIDQVLDQADDKNGIRRIEKLEIDLGEIAPDYFKAEFARRLHAQLSSALSMPREQTTEPVLLAEMAIEDSQYLEDFLRTGQLAWAAAADPRNAHSQLLERVTSTQAGLVAVRAFIDDSLMRRRMVLQYDTSQLMRTLEKLIVHWSKEQSQTMLLWAQLELQTYSKNEADAQTYWYWLLPQTYHQPAAISALLHTWSKEQKRKVNHVVARYRQQQIAEKISVPQFFWKELGGNENNASPALKQILPGSRKKTSSEKISKNIAAEKSETGVPGFDPEQLYKDLSTGKLSITETDWQQLIHRHADTIRRARAQGWSHWLKKFPTDRQQDLAAILHSRATWLLEQLANRFSPTQAAIVIDAGLAILLKTTPGTIQSDAFLQQVLQATNIKISNAGSQTNFPEILTANITEEKNPQKLARLIDEQQTSEPIASANVPLKQGKQRKTKTLLEDEKAIATSRLPAQKITLTQLYKALENAESDTLETYWDKLFDQHADLIRQAQPGAWRLWLEKLTLEQIHALSIVLQPLGMRAFEKLLVNIDIQERQKLLALVLPYLLARQPESVQIEELLDDIPRLRKLADRGSSFAAKLADADDVWTDSMVLHHAAREIPTAIDQLSPVYTDVSTSVAAFVNMLHTALIDEDVHVLTDIWASGDNEKYLLLREVWPLIKQSSRQRIILQLPRSMLADWVRILQPQAESLLMHLQQQAPRMLEAMLSMESDRPAAYQNIAIHANQDLSKSGPQQLLVKAYLHLIQAETDTVNQQQIIQSLLMDISNPKELARAWLSLPDLKQQANQLDLALQEWVSLASTDRIPGQAETLIDPDLVNFHQWKQGQLSVWEIDLSVRQAKQWLNWWFSHNADENNHDYSTLSQTIEAYCEETEHAVTFLKLLLESLQHQEAVDLDFLLGETDRIAAKNTSDTLTARIAEANTVDATINGNVVNSSTGEDSVISVAAQNLQLWLEQGKAQRINFHQLIQELKLDSKPLDTCDSAQLYRLLFTYLNTEYTEETRKNFLQAIENFALDSADLGIYLRLILKNILQQEVVDLEQIRVVSQQHPVQEKIDAINKAFPELREDFETQHEINEAYSEANNFTSPQAQVLNQTTDISVAWDNLAFRLWLFQLLENTIGFTRIRHWLAALEEQAMQNKTTSIFLLVLFQRLIELQTPENKLRYQSALSQHFAIDDAHLAWMAHPDNAKKMALLQEKIDYCFMQEAVFKQKYSIEEQAFISNQESEKTGNETASGDRTPASDLASLAADTGTSLSKLDQDTSNVAGKAQVLYEAFIPGVTPRPDATEQKISATPPQPSPSHINANLPHRIAQALLQANVENLLPVWSKLIAEEKDLLAQGLRRYMVRPEEQRRLLARTNPNLIIDLIGVLSPEAGKILASIWKHWDVCYALSAKPLASEKLKEKMLANSLSFALVASTGAFSREDFLRKSISLFVSRSNHEADMIELAQAWHDQLSDSKPPVLFHTLETILYGRQYLQLLQQRISNEKIEEFEAINNADKVELNRVVDTQKNNCVPVIHSLANKFPELLSEFIQTISEGDLNSIQFSETEWQEIIFSLLNQRPPSQQAEFWQLFTKTIPGLPKTGLALFNQAESGFSSAAFAGLDYRAGIQHLLNQTMRQERSGDPAMPEIAASSALQALNKAIPINQHAIDLGKKPLPSANKISNEANSTQIASEAMLAFSLQRMAEPDNEQKILFTLKLQDLFGDNQYVLSGILAHALADPQSVRRLVKLIPGSSLQRLLGKLRPEFKDALPILFQQLEDNLDVAVPVTAAFVWQIVYEALFVEQMTKPDKNFTQALIKGLAVHYQTPDATAWLDKMMNPALNKQAHVNTNSQEVKKVVKAVSPNLQPDTSGQPPDEPVHYDIDVNNIYINNGGLILVTPYLQRLFGLLDLTKDGRFQDEACAQRAVHLLQFIVTGELETPEYQLVLNKLLCGIKGGTPICRGIEISDTERDTIEQLLAGIVTNWGALGNTSNQGLRETFLQRQAHLYWQDDAWQMKVLPGTFDMLLDRLPWSFALTRFPWMQEPIHTSWRG